MEDNFKKVNQYRTNTNALFLEQRHFLSRKKIIVVWKVKYSP